MFGHNVAFGFKMLFILLAGINILILFVGGTARNVEALGPGDDPPLDASLEALPCSSGWNDVLGPHASFHWQCLLIYEFAAIPTASDDKS
jgi:hypothetical protein